ncbi:MAG: TolC family protein [Fusobacteriaceae bacterium]
MKIKIFILLVIYSSMLFSEDVKKIKINLDDAIERAYEHDYILKNSKLDLDNSNLKLKESYKNFLPTLDYNGKYLKYEQEVNSNNQMYENQISVTQSIYSGGVLSANLKKSEIDKEKKQYLLMDTKISTYLTTIDKYISILSFNEQLNVYKYSLENLYKEHEVVKRKYDLDMIAKSEILPFNTRILNIKTKILETENMIAISEIDLKNYIGLLNDTKIDLAPVDKKKYDISAIKLDEDVKFVRENNRTVKINQLELKTKEADKKIAKSEFLPKIDAVISQKSNDKSYSNSHDDYNWEAGVSFKMNIFEFGKSIDNYRISDNEVKKSKNIEAKIKNDTELELRKSYLNLVKYENIVKEQKAAVESAEENFMVESRRYQLGLIDAIELIEIEKILLESRLSLIVENYNYYIAYEIYNSLLK